MTTFAFAFALASTPCAYAGPELHPPVEFPLPGSGEAAPASMDALDEVARQVAERFDGAAVAMAVSHPAGEVWSAVSGAGEDALFQWASVGKTFTAAAIMQLAQDGALSLDDEVAEHVSGIPNGEIATIRDLLSHTAGLPNLQAYMADTGAEAPETIAAELALLREAGAVSCPGAAFSYSNSGYAVLGLIIERVTGEKWRDVVARRVIEPLALERMAVIHASEDDLVPARATARAPLDPEAPGAAGPIAASAADMARFWREFLEGDVVSQTSLDTMFERLYPFPDGDNHYGLGVQLFDLDPPGGESYYLGHLGGMPGINTSVIYSPGDDIVVAVAVSGEAPAAAISARLLGAASGAAD